ncbi:MAG: DinB family protein [Bacteroidetes bacterium]|nr:DinB family protein [Bacteroidota bacterium]
MSSKNLIDELEFEVESTRKLLERVPAGRLTWKPHEKAMSLGQLAFHVASIPGNYVMFANEGKTKVEVLVEHYVPETKEEIAERWVESMAKAREVLGRATEEWDAESWELIKNGESVFKISRGVMCRLLVMNHWIHHRGELVTYLRALDVTIPSVYGPSADENPFE